MSDTTDSTEQMQSTPDAGGRGQLVNDSGDATLLLHEGTGLEITLGNDGILPDPENSVNPVIKRVMQWVKASNLTVCQPVDANIGPQEENDEQRDRRQKSDTLATRST